MKRLSIKDALAWAREAVLVAPDKPVATKIIRESRDKEDIEYEGAD